MVDYNRLNLNNIYKNWLQNNIESATAKGLLGGDNPLMIAKEDLVKPIDDIINNAKKMLNSKTRGMMVGNGTITSGGPTSASIPKQLPSVINSGVPAKTNYRIPKVQPKINTPDVINMYPNDSIKLLSTNTKKIIPGTNIGKGLGGALGWGATLLPAWYGKDELGAVGPGRAVLEDTPWGQLIFGKPEISQEIIDANEEANKAIKSLRDKLSKRKDNNANDSKKDDVSSGNNTTKAKTQAVVNAVVNSQPQEQQVLEGGVTEEATPEEVSTILQQASDRNAPYIRALEQYLASYPKLLEQSGRNDLYFYGANLAKGLNPKAGEKFNQVKNYENMVGIVKAIEDAKNATTDYANEVAGNSAIAQDIGLPQEAAFANKNLLSAYSMRERDKVKQAIADANNLVRRYGIDKRAAIQLALQNLRNENALAVAGMYSGMGYPGVGLAPTGQAQSTSVAPVQYPQQQPMSQEESVYAQIKRNKK